MPTVTGFAADAAEKQTQAIIDTAPEKPAAEQAQYVYSGAIQPDPDTDDPMGYGSVRPTQAATDKEAELFERLAEAERAERARRTRQRAEKAANRSGGDAEAGNAEAESARNDDDSLRKFRVVLRRVDQTSGAEEYVLAHPIALRSKMRFRGGDLQDSALYFKTLEATCSSPSCPGYAELYDDAAQRLDDMPALTAAVEFLRANPPAPGQGPRLFESPEQLYDDARTMCKQLSGAFFKFKQRTFRGMLGDETIHDAQMAALSEMCADISDSLIPEIQTKLTAMMQSGNDQDRLIAQAVLVEVWTEAAAEFRAAFDAEIQKLSPDDLNKLADKRHDQAITGIDSAKKYTYEIFRDYNNALGMVFMASFCTPLAVIAMLPALLDILFAGINKYGEIDARRSVDDVARQRARKIDERSLMMAHIDASELLLERYLECAKNGDVNSFLTNVQSVLNFNDQLETQYKYDKDKSPTKKTINNLRNFNSYIASLYNAYNSFAAENFEREVEAGTKDYGLLIAKFNTYSRAKDAATEQFRRQIFSDPDRNAGAKQTDIAGTPAPEMPKNLAAQERRGAGRKQKPAGLGERLGGFSGGAAGAMLTLLEDRENSEWFLHTYSTYNSRDMLDARLRGCGCGNVSGPGRSRTAAEAEKTDRKGSRGENAMLSQSAMVSYLVADYQAQTSGAGAALPAEKRLDVLFKLLAPANGSGEIKYGMDFFREAFGANREILWRQVWDGVKKEEGYECSEDERRRVKEYFTAVSAYKALDSHLEKMDDKDSGTLGAYYIRDFAAQLAGEAAALRDGLEKQRPGIIDALVAVSKDLAESERKAVAGGAGKEAASRAGVKKTLSARGVEEPDDADLLSACADRLEELAREDRRSDEVKNFGADSPYAPRKPERADGCPAVDPPASPPRPGWDAPEPRAAADSPVVLVSSAPSFDWGKDAVRERRRERGRRMGMAYESPFGAPRSALPDQDLLKTADPIDYSRAPEDYAFGAAAAAAEKKERERRIKAEKERERDELYDLGRSIIDHPRPFASMVDLARAGRALDFEPAEAAEIRACKDSLLKSYMAAYGAGQEAQGKGEPGQSAAEKIGRQNVHGLKGSCDREIYQLFKAANISGIKTSAEVLAAHEAGFDATRGWSPGPERA